MKRLRSWLIRDEQNDGWLLFVAALLAMELFFIGVGEPDKATGHFVIAGTYVLLAVWFEVSTQRKRRKEAQRQRRLGDHK